MVGTGACLVAAIVLMPAHGLVVREVGRLSRASNICVHGRLAPELYLFGPGRSSTTLFGRNIGLSPGVVFGTCKTGCPDTLMRGVKEMNFYNKWDGNVTDLSDYLAHYPICQNKSRLVAMDLTPGFDAAMRVPQIYGEQKSAVKFVSLLRNPLKVLHSLFYHFHLDEKQSFADYAQALVKTSEGGFFWPNVLYAPTFRTFVTTFAPAQLFVCPYQYNLVEWNGMARFPFFLWKELGVPPPAAGVHLYDEVGAGLYPPLEKDLTSGLLESLQSYVDGITGSRIVAELFASHMPHLYGYQGARGDARAINAWLTDGW